MSIDAMLSLLAFFCVLGLFLETASEQLQETEKAVSEFKAVAEAKKCALLVDSVFSNNGILQEAIGTSCFQNEKGTVSAKLNDFEASSSMLAESVFLNQESSATILEVKSNAHYK